MTVQNALNSNNRSEIRHLAHNMASHNASSSYTSARASLTPSQLEPQAEDTRMQILDNLNNGRVIETLKDNCDDGHTMSMTVNDFSIHAFDQLAQKLLQSKNFRLLLKGGLLDSETQLIDFSKLLGDKSELAEHNQLQQTYLAKKLAEWLQKAADVRVAETNTVPSNCFLVKNKDSGSIAIQGSSEFTLTGLGVKSSKRRDMNMLIADDSQVQALEQWFLALWNDAQSVKDGKEELLHALKEIYRDRDARHIYFTALYNVFQDILTNVDEENLTRTGFKNTEVWNKLYNFQRDGVLGAIDKIEKHNGCILADSVGLGKTFEALAVIKYYELRNDRVLVLCPKRLRDNWSLYRENDKRNILLRDRFNYDILNHTDLTRTSGLSGDINLETLNWGNYDLIVIDESHNFRNAPVRNEGMTRYARLLEEVIKQGVNTKVMLLSATPVNNRMNDLKNQIAFITAGNAAALADSSIPNYENTLRRAQTKFNEWQAAEGAKTSQGLIESLSHDFFRLLELLTISRSRKHIEKYYDDPDVGKFPERLQPFNPKPDFDTADRLPEIKAINKTIISLSLCAYSPVSYLKMNKVAQYAERYDHKLKSGSVFSQADRESSLIHLMRVNLLKRLESSIHSFGLTLGKLLKMIEDILARIDDESLQEFNELDITEIDPEADDYAPFMVGKKVKVLLKDIDLMRWRPELEGDAALLRDLLEKIHLVDAATDAKLADLKGRIRNKVENPINPGNNKVLVFSAFSDTAEYLYNHISEWAQNELGLHCGLICGDRGPRTTLPKSVRREQNSLLTHFSPISKERGTVDPDASAEIDLLFATDCISEGQNLQDCDFLVNYDIHWNPVRIIQRFGRIDRIGSKNDKIQLVNYWPNLELDEYINLEERVSGRMVLLDISANGEENVIEYQAGDEMNDLHYRKRQLEQLQEKVLDYEDLNDSISITDLTLNDFRMDLAEYIKTHKIDLDNTPHGSHAVVSYQGETDAPTAIGNQAGAIFLLRDVDRKFAASDAHPLAPYFLVHVSDSGEVIHGLEHQQTRKCLELFKNYAIGSESLDSSAQAALATDTQKGKRMAHYQGLLQTALEAIAGKNDELGTESLFNPLGSSLATELSAGIDDIEVVAWLIIKECTSC